MTTKQFRFLLIIFLGMEIFNGSLNNLFPELIPKSLLDAKEINDVNQFKLNGINNLIIVIVFFGTWISSLIGLFLFKSWAPKMALIATLVSLITAPILGINVSSGWEVLLSDLTSTLWGSILGLVYLTPFKTHFKSGI